MANTKSVDIRSILELKRLSQNKFSWHDCGFQDIGHYTFDHKFYVIAKFWRISFI